MGASKRRQMSGFDDDWPAQMWSAASARNGGAGAAWLPALAALAVTGCRPASLERGIDFAIINDNGKNYIEAKIKGVKVSENRGQPEYIFRWATTKETHCPDELLALAELLAISPGRKITIRYDAEGISTRLREISTALWPRRKHKISAYCYRHLLSSNGKAAGVSPEELALAMGHLSSESQGQYSRASGRGRSGGVKPWGTVQASRKVKVHRSPMARFKASKSLEKATQKKHPSGLIKSKKRVTI